MYEPPTSWFRRKKPSRFTRRNSMYDPTEHQIYMERELVFQYGLLILASIGLGVSIGWLVRAFMT